jgi:chemotaxis protein MotB
MARKKKQEEVVNTEGWLTTFADLLSLLLCFFVMMYIASVPDDARMQWILRSFSNVRGNVVNLVTDDDYPDGDTDESTDGVAPNIEDNEGERPGVAGSMPMTFDDMFNWVADLVEAHDLKDSVSVEMFEGRMHIRFNDEIMFDAESSELRPQGQAALRQIAPGIQAVNRFIASAEVAGHTAPAPPGVNPERWGVTNPWVLSGARATNVTVFLDGINMVDSDKFVSKGHGPHDPHYAVDNEQSNRRNRRVELILTRNEFAPDDTPSMLDTLMYDYLFPLLPPGGPLTGRQPSPGFIDSNQQVWNRIKDLYKIDEEIFEPPAPTPSDGRGFDFRIPTIP